MTCGQRVSTPYGSGLIVALKGDESVIVALDSGDYVEVGVDYVSTSAYHRRVEMSDSAANLQTAPAISSSLTAGVVLSGR